jgi:hypothetical protein
MGLEIFTLRERADLRSLVFAPELESVWPEYMRNDAAAHLYFAPQIFDSYLDYAFAGVAEGEVVARAFSVPSPSISRIAPNSPMAVGIR